MQIESPEKLVAAIEFSYARVERWSDGVIMIQVDDQHEMLEHEHAHALMRAVKELANGERIFLIASAGAATSADENARRHFADREHKEFVRAMAIVVLNMAQRLIANFFININRPAFRTRVFNSVEDARRWLKKQPDP